MIQQENKSTGMTTITVVEKQIALGCYTALRQEQTPEGRLPFSVVKNIDNKEQ